MKSLANGTELEPGDIRAPGAGEGSNLVIEEPMTHFPHGTRYRGHQDGVRVLITIFDPLLVADHGQKAQLQRGLKAAAALEHRSLLPLYGFGRTSGGFAMVEADPDGTTVRGFLRERIKRGKSVDAEAVYTLVAHVCNALSRFHEVQIHGFVTADTVLVSQTGRVYLSTPAVGPLLASCRDFGRYRQAGRLPNVAPEQTLAPPQLAAGTDIFGVATLFIQMLTGQALEEAGQSLAELGLMGPESLVQCLERATAPSNMARPPDIETFKSELAQAIHEGPAIRSEEPFWVRRSSSSAGESSAVNEVTSSPGSQASPLPPPPMPMHREQSGVSHMPMAPGMHYPYPPAYPYASYPYSAAPGYPMPPMGYPAGSPPGYPVPPGYPPPGAVAPPEHPGVAAPAASASAVPQARPNPVPAPEPRARPAPSAPAPSSDSSDSLELAFEDLMEDPVPRPVHRKPPPPAPGSASRSALEEFGAALDKFADLDEDAADSFTSLVDGSSVDTLTKHSDEQKAQRQVNGLQGKRESEREKKARADAKNAKKAKAAPAPDEDPSTSSSMLGLSMSFEDAADRLSTLDGTPDNPARGAKGSAAGPSVSGTFFSSFAEPAESEDGEESSDEGEEDFRDRSPVYFLVNRGVTHGPLSLYELVRRGQAGNIDNGAMLQHRVTGEEIRADAHPVLRRYIRRPEEIAAALAAMPRRTPVRSPPVPKRRSRALGTALWVVLTLAMFAAAGWYLYGGH